MLCDDKTRLLDEFNDAVKAYSSAVRELTERAGTTSLDQYMNFTVESEEARLKCEDARLQLERHRLTHGC